MVVFAEDPERFKETLDLAVIVPELHARFARRFRVALLPPAASRAVLPRYGFARWPAFVMLRDGRYLGAVDGIRDWDVYVGELERLLAAEPTRPPTRRHSGPCRRAGRIAVLPLRGAQPMRPVTIPIRSLMPEPDEAIDVHADAARDEHLRDAAPARAGPGQRHRRRARRAGDLPRALRRLAGDGRRATRARPRVAWRPTRCGC